MHLGIESLAIKKFGLKKPEKLASWLNNLWSNPKGEEESERAIKWYSL